LADHSEKEVTPTHLAAQVFSEVDPVRNGVYVLEYLITLQLSFELIVDSDRRVLIIVAWV